MLCEPLGKHRAVVMRHGQVEAAQTWRLGGDGPIACLAGREVKARSGARRCDDAHNLRAVVGVKNGEK